MCRETDTARVQNILCLCYIVRQTEMANDRGFIYGAHEISTYSLKTRRRKTKSIPYIQYLKK